MCGIIGLFGEGISYNNQSKIILNNLDSMRCRGNDGFGFCTDSVTFKTKNYELFKNRLKQIIVNNNNNLKNKPTRVMIHFLHSIVGNVCQPLVSHVTHNKLVFNGEIYNWKELKKQFKLKSKNDAEVLLELLDKSIPLIEITKLINGVYAFAFWNNKDNTVTVMRDILGEKPICYYQMPNKKNNKNNTGVFMFASENKTLNNKGILLDPKKYLVYNVKKNVLKVLQRKDLLKLNKGKILEDNKKPAIKKELTRLFKKAVSMRTNGLSKYGILFSGGIDSTVLVFLAKKAKQKFICYNAAFQEGNIRNAPDLEQAKHIAEKYNLSLKTKIVSLKEVERDLPEIIKIIESNNPIKVGVALPFYYCGKLAKKDGVKVVISGLGSEELFAGYKRHEDILNKYDYKNNIINKECLNGLNNIWERDLYRDDLITMHHNLELRLPFLDRELVEFALNIPAEYKIIKKQKEGKSNKIDNDNVDECTKNDECTKKLLLREIAIDMGLDRKFAMRKKCAAQYGSNFDRALEKLAKKNKYKGKKEYLYSLTAATTTD